MSIKLVRGTTNALSIRQPDGRHVFTTTWVFLINNATIDQAATSKVGWQKSFLELGDERLDVHPVQVSCQWVAGTWDKLVVRASIDPDTSHENDDGKPSGPRHTTLLDPGR